jgi:hypothetical protein
VRFPVAAFAALIALFALAAWIDDVPEEGGLIPPLVEYAPTTIAGGGGITGQSGGTNPTDLSPGQVDAPPTSTSTTAPPPPPPRTSQTISSTAYCETGRMANGEPAHDGAVSSKTLPRGSAWRVLSGPYEGRVLVVKDTGSKAYFDIAMPGDCAGAVQYGRRTIEIAEA